MTPRSALVRLGLALSLLLSAGPAAAECHGTDLLARLSPEERAALVGDAPYASGNLWRATRGDATLILIGTFHLADPRGDALLARFAPLVRAADTLLVEAGPTEDAALKADIAAHPEHMFTTTGATLPERLDAPTWQAFAAAMRARGIPPFLAAKFRPWYAAMLLGLPPCARERLAASQTAGLDKRLIAVAQAAGVPVRALEPYDTAFRAFDAIPVAAQLDLLRATLATDDPDGDFLATTANAYFAGEHRLIWQFSLSEAETRSGLSPGTVRHDFALMEAGLVTGRNRAWLPVLEQAAAGRSVAAAFGAGHLGGRDGVLNLLHRAGFTLTRLDP